MSFFFRFGGSVCLDSMSYPCVTIRLFRDSSDLYLFFGLTSMRSKFGRIGVFTSLATRFFMFIIVYLYLSTTNKEPKKPSMQPNFPPNHENPHSNNVTLNRTFMLNNRLSQHEICIK